MIKNAEWAKINGVIINDFLFLLYITLISYHPPLVLGDAHLPVFFSICYLNYPSPNTHALLIGSIALTPLMMILKVADEKFWRPEGRRRLFNGKTTCHYPWRRLRYYREGF